MNNITNNLIYKVWHCYFGESSNSEPQLRKLAYGLSRNQGAGAAEKGLFSTVNYISIVTVATMTNDITDEVHFVAAMPNKQWTRCGQRPAGLPLAHVSAILCPSF